MPGGVPRREEAWGGSEGLGDAWGFWVLAAARFEEGSADAWGGSEEGPSSGMCRVVSRRVARRLRCLYARVLFVIGAVRNLRMNSGKPERLRAPRPQAGRAIQLAFLFAS